MKKPINPDYPPPIFGCWDTDPIGAFFLLACCVGMLIAVAVTVIQNWEVLMK